MRLKSPRISAMIHFVCVRLVRRSCYRSDDEEWSVLSVASSELPLWLLLLLSHCFFDWFKHGNDTLSLSMSHANCKASACFVGDNGLGRNDCGIDSDGILRWGEQRRSCFSPWILLTESWFMVLWTTRYYVNICMKYEGTIERMVCGMWMAEEQRSTMKT